MSAEESGGKRNFLAQHEMVEVTIADEIRRVRAMSKWSGGNRHVESLVKGDGINVALVMLKKGARLDEHSNKSPFSVQVVEGSIAFIASGERRVLGPGRILAARRELPHAVEALEDSAFILTLGGESH
jgi:quercetin dioxygenase-like cupin family protein